MGELKCKWQKERLLLRDVDLSFTDVVDRKKYTQIEFDSFMAKLIQCLTTVPEEEVRVSGDVSEVSIECLSLGVRIKREYPYWIILR